MGGVVKAVKKNIVPIAITAAVVATAGAAAPAAATWLKYNRKRYSF